MTIGVQFGDRDEGCVGLIGFEALARNLFTCQQLACFSSCGLVTTTVALDDLLVGASCIAAVPLTLHSIVCKLFKVWQVVLAHCVLHLLWLLLLC